jgi:hypothetical protein
MYQTYTERNDFRTRQTENKSAHPAAEANLDAGHVRRSLIHVCAVHVRLMGIKAPDTKASTELHTNKQEKD